MTIGETAVRPRRLTAAEGHRRTVPWVNTDLIFAPDGETVIAAVHPVTGEMIHVEPELWKAYHTLFPMIDDPGPGLALVAGHDDTIARLVEAAHKGLHLPPVSDDTGVDYRRIWGQFVTWAGHHIPEVDVNALLQADIETLAAAYLVWLAKPCDLEVAKKCRRRSTDGYSTSTIENVWAALRWVVACDRGLQIEKTAQIAAAFKTGAPAELRADLTYDHLVLLIAEIDKGPEANGYSLRYVPKVARELRAELWRLTERARQIVTWPGGLRTGEVVELQDGWITPIADDERLVQFPKTKARPEGTQVAIVGALDENMNALAAIDAVAEAFAAAGIDRRGYTIPLVVLRGSDVISSASHAPRCRTAAARFARYVANAGIKSEHNRQLVPHSMRHGSTTALREAGASDEQIVRHNRHVSPETTARYGTSPGSSPTKGLL